MSKLNISGTCWEGGPVKLTESILTRKATTNGNFDSFVSGMMSELNKAKDDLDATLASVDFEQSKAIRNKTTAQAVVEDIDTKVDEDVKNIKEDQYKEKLKECLKLQYQAASFIVDLKGKVKEAEENNKDIADKAEQQNVTFKQQIEHVEQSWDANAKKYNVDIGNRIKLTKLVGLNPPPKFDSYKGFGTSTGLLTFLNEDMEDYFEDICVWESREKCRLIMKMFGPKSENYKATARRFFSREEVADLVMNDTVDIKIIYKELVHFMFAEKPRGDVGNRKDGESLTNFLMRWFTIKDYCGIGKQSQGRSILKAIFRKPEILRCTEEVLREIKKKYFVKHAKDQDINKEELLGFSERLDMLYSTKNELGIHAIGVAKEESNQVPTSMVVLDNRKTEYRDIKDTVKSVMEEFITGNANCNNYDHDEIFNGRGNNTGNRPQWRKPPVCYNCGKSGHISVHCRVGHDRVGTANKGNYMYDGCWSCGSPDHLRQSCPSNRNFNAKRNNQFQEGNHSDSDTSKN